GGHHRQRQVRTGGPGAGGGRGARGSARVRAVVGQRRPGRAVRERREDPRVAHRPRAAGGREVVRRVGATALPARRPSRCGGGGAGGGGTGRSRGRTSRRAPWWSGA